MVANHYAESSLELNRHIVNLLDSLSALHGLTEISLRDQDEPQLLKLALERLISNQDLERCSIFLLNEDGTLTNAAGLDWDDMLRDITHSTPAATPHTPSKAPYRRGEGIMGRAAESGEIVHCRSCLDDPQFKKFNIGDKPVQGSLMCIPITCEDQVLGVLNVYYPLPDFFNMWHERLLVLFCMMLGRLLINHRLMHHLSTLVDQRTNELVLANADLKKEMAHRQKAQAELANQHHFLQTIIDGMLEPVMVIGADYRVMLSNQAAKTSHSHTGEVAQFCYQISHQRQTPCDGKDHQCPLELVLKTRLPITVVHEHVNAQMEPRQIELMASPLIDKEGKVIGIIEGARDITERVLVEKKLIAFNEALELRVHEEVARNMANERLIIHQSRLAVMGEMVGNIAHQWRQPINALTLVLANIKDAHEYNELDKECLDNSVQSGQKLIQAMSSTIDDFRNFFNPNKIKQEFSLNQAIKEAIQLMGHSFNNYNVSVLFEAAADIQANGYPNEFTQTLLNILANTKDAMLEREIHAGVIEIELRQAGNMACVCVKDNAGGIPIDVLPKVFDPYFTTKEKGTGIGLYMSKMIMENMGGSITVNNVGNGVQVLLCVPLV